MIKTEKYPSGIGGTIVVQFKPKAKNVNDMTANEILEHLHDRFGDKIIVLALDQHHLLEINTNATLERANWMLDRAKKLLLQDE